jgi:hypothetical protein
VTGRVDSGNTFGITDFAVFCFLIISTLGKLFNMQHVKVTVLLFDFSISGGNEGHRPTGLHSLLFRETSELIPPPPDSSRGSEGNVVQIGTCTLWTLRHALRVSPVARHAIVSIDSWVSEESEFKLFEADVEQRVL